MNALLPVAAKHLLVRADPACRLAARYSGRRPIGAAWAGAAGLHGALVAALIFSWPVRTAVPPPDPAPISYVVVQAPDTASSAATVRAKPPSEKAVTPPAPRQNVAASLPARAVAARPVASFLTHQTVVKPMLPRAGILQNNATMPTGTAEKSAAKPLAGSANQPPEYPEPAQLHGEQGKVLLSIHVLPDGAADRVEIAQSSGFKLLDQAAMDAVLKWRFQPAMQAGQPVASEVPYWIYFKLVD